MEEQKRLNKSDYIMVYFIIFVLISFIGGFFLGASTMKTRMAKEYALLQEQAGSKDKKTENNVQYPHTDFVSFYHSIYMPYEKFRTDLYSYLQNTQNKGNENSSMSSAIEVKKKAEEILHLLKKTDMFSASPSLSEARNMYIKSLQAYIDGFSSGMFQLKKDNANNSLGTFDQVSAAQRYWLSGQTLFYQGIMEWETLHSNKKPTPDKLDKLKEITSLSEWYRLSLHQKNYIIAHVLSSIPLVVPYNPEDITVHLDAAARSGGGESFNNLQKAVQILNAAKAVKKGDFLLEKNELYENASYPLLPLFSK